MSCGLNLKKKKKSMTCGIYIIIYFYYCSGIGPRGPLHMLYNGPKAHAEDEIFQKGSC